MSAVRLSPVLLPSHCFPTSLYPFLDFYSSHCLSFLHSFIIQLCIPRHFRQSCTFLICLFTVQLPSHIPSFSVLKNLSCLICIVSHSPDFSSWLHSTVQHVPLLTIFTADWQLDAEAWSGWDSLFGKILGGVAFFNDKAHNVQLSLFSLWY